MSTVSVQLVRRLSTVLVSDVGPLAEWGKRALSKAALSHTHTHIKHKRYRRESADLISETPTTLSTSSLASYKPQTCFQELSIASFPTTPALLPRGCPHLYLLMEIDLPTSQRFLMGTSYGVRAAKPNYLLSSYRITLVGCSKR